MVGFDRISDKDKRRVRIQNHITRDLRAPKYKQKRVEGKKPSLTPPDIDDWDEE